MFFNSAFYLVPFCLQLLLSIFALIFLAVKWQSSSAKALMVVVIVLGFLIPSILAVVSTLLYAGVSSSGFNVGLQFFQMFIGLITIVARVLPLLTLGVLLFYIVQRKKVDEEFSWFLKNSVASEGSQQALPVPFAAKPAVLPKAWNTEMDSKLRINILRRREWGFLIDVLPVIAFNVFCLWIMGMSQFENSFSRNPLEGLCRVLLGLATVGLIIYLPFKDSINGVSFGKMFSKCRVVKTQGGSPIGVGESFARNVLFLIPLMAIVELAVASLRPDRKRLGDLIAGTTVVTGEPDFVDGLKNENKQPESEEEKTATPHPLDD